MELFLITSLNPAKDPLELAGDLMRFYKSHPHPGNLCVYCTRTQREHRIWFVVEAEGIREALQTIPPHLLCETSTVVQIEEVYRLTRGLR